MIFNKMSSKLIFDSNIKVIVKPSQEFDEGSFILANLDFSGFYRVNYDKENWDMIIKQLKTNKKVHIFILDLKKYLIKSLLK
jgi:hypothetical protein